MIKLWIAALWTACSAPSAPANIVSAAEAQPDLPLQRDEVDIAVPDVTLTERSGQAVRLPALTLGEQPVMVQFVFTSCSTICPVMVGTFSAASEALGPDAERVRMVSISIDPQNDTPEKLREYAERFKAPANWSFLTGAQEDVSEVRRRFGVDNGSKFNHKPVTFLHLPGKTPWVRLSGSSSAGRLAAEVRRELGATP